MVIHRSNSSGDGPQVPEIIGKVMLQAGSNSNVSIQLEESVSDGETLWAMLHYDTGTDGEYEFDGESGLDLPVIFNGNIVLTSFTVQQNQSSLTAMDQAVMNNSITVDVDIDTDGWVVVHRSNEAGDGPQVPQITGIAGLIIFAFLTRSLHNMTTIIHNSK